VPDTTRQTCFQVSAGVAPLVLETVVISLVAPLYTAISRSLVLLLILIRILSAGAPAPKSKILLKFLVMDEEI
jgi:hypothetical protein